MRARQLRDLTDDELEKKLSETRRELFNLRFQAATGQLENNARMGEVRKQIARFNTEIRMRQIAAAEALEARLAGQSLSSSTAGES